MPAATTTHDQKGHDQKGHDQRGQAQRGQAHEEWLLLASALTAAYRRAGQIPQATSATLAPAPPESKRYCSAPLADHLATILSDTRALEPLLIELLLLLAEKGRIVPPALLPDLLTWGQRFKERAALVAPVAGERGLWLTQLNPAWKKMLQFEDSNFVTRQAAIIMPRITGQFALYSALNIDESETNNIFSKGLSLLKGQGFSAHGRLIQLSMDKLTTLAKPKGTYYGDQEVSKIAVAIPAAALPDFISQTRKALANQELMPWLSDLADRLEFRQQILEELSRE